MDTSATDPLAPYYFKHEPQQICGIDIAPITDDWVDNYPSVVDRFFTRYYYIKPGADVAPYQVLFHSNRVCLIGLAPEHPALKAGIKSVNFDVGNTDRSKNTVKGKGKKGGMALQPDSTLALLTAETGEMYKIPSCITSKLVEVNMLWVEQPKLLEKAGEGDGYVAIVLPKPEHCDEIKRSLLTQEEYSKQWAAMKAMNVARNGDEECNVAANGNATTV